MFKDKCDLPKSKTVIKNTRLMIAFCLGVIVVAGCNSGGGGGGVTTSGSQSVITNSEGNQITRFYINGQPAYIENNRINAFISATEDLGNIIVQFEATGDKVFVNGQLQEEIQIHDFTMPLTYTVISAKNERRDYLVTVKKSPFDRPKSLAVNTQTDSLFVVNSHNFLACNTSTKHLVTSCKEVKIPGLLAPASIAINSQAGLAYVGDSINHKIITCKVNGSQLTDCQDSGANLSNEIPEEIKLSPDGKKALIKVQDGSYSRFNQCSAEGQSLINCMVAEDDKLSQASDVVFRPGTGKLFIRNFDISYNSYSACKFSPIGLADCQPVSLVDVDWIEPKLFFNNHGNIALIKSTTFDSADSTFRGLSSCSVTDSDMLGNCKVNSIKGLSSVGAIGFSKDDKYLWVSDLYGNAVFSCEVNLDGGIKQCQRYPEYHF